MKSQRKLTPVLAIAIWLICGGSMRIQEIDVPHEIAQVKTMPPCCMQYADMKFEDLPGDDSTYFSIDDSTPTFNFGGDGVSRFKAYKLPTDTNKHTLMLESRMLADISGNPGTFDYRPTAYFYPKIEFLDADFHDIGAVTSHDAPRNPAEIDPDITIWLGKFPSARFIVIHTTDLLMQQGGEWAVRPHDTMPIATLLQDAVGARKPTDRHIEGSPISPEERMVIEFKH